MASTIENQMSSAQVIGNGSLATSDLKATATSGGLVTDSISSATGTAGGIAAAQLHQTSTFGGVTDGTTVATGDQGGYASSQCMNIAQGNANNPDSTGAECNLGAQATGVFGDSQSQAQTAAANLSFNGGATSLLGSQAGSGATSNLVTATTDFAAVQPVDAQASNALSVAGGCLVGVGCGIVIAQANIPANPGGEGCDSGGISSNSANCATASVTGATSAINGGGVEGAGIAATIGGQGVPNYGSSLLTTIPGVGATFQLDSKTGSGDAIASSVIKLTP
jgi:hypothetical protein